MKRHRPDTDPLPATSQFPPPISAADPLDDRETTYVRGQQPSTGDDLQLNEQLARYPEMAARIIFQELWLHRPWDGQGAFEEILERFPQWKEELIALRDQPAPETSDRPHFPETGDTLGEFHLKVELGRGAAGRVFLAQQTSLANRSVVLKLSPLEGEEHLSLARLQHTHIMPLYGAQDFPERRLRLLCMPYLGMTTLGILFDRLIKRPVARRTGLDILQILEEEQQKVAEPVQSRKSLANPLGGLTYSRAICRIGAALAGALGYAHARGVLHLDLKPENILLTPEGEPIILDFHVAREPIQPGGVPPGWLGGTPDYMSPEQLQAFEALRRGKPIETAVDGRSDLFSLGLVLFEALGGRRTPEGLADLKELPAWNPQVTPGLVGILQKCLMIRAKDRYPDAQALADDLQRYVEDQPLRGVRNRSWKEGWQRWRRRKPFALPLGLLIAGFVFSAAWAGGTWFLSWENRRRLAETALLEGQDLVRTARFADAQRTFLRGKEAALAWPEHAQLALALESRLRLTHRLQKAQELQFLVHALRFYSVQDHIPRRMLLILQIGSQALWKDRNLLLSGQPGEIEPGQEQRIRQDLLDLAILWTEQQVRFAPAAKKEQAHQRAQTVLDEAENLVGGNLALYQEQLVHARALGQEEQVLELEKKRQTQTPGEAAEFAALGRYYLRTGDPHRARPMLERALVLQPRDYVAHFFLGVCLYRLQEPALAEIEFTFCLGQFPIAECYYFRGLCRRDRGKIEEALADFDSALALNDQLGPAYLERGLLHLDREEENQARSDLDAAQRHEADPERVKEVLARLKPQS